MTPFFNQAALQYKKLLKCSGKQKLTEKKVQNTACEF